MKELEIIQAKKLGELFIELSEKGTHFERLGPGGWARVHVNPESINNLDNWRVSKIKNRKIDMFCVADTRIDIEFSDSKAEWIIAKLLGIDDNAFLASYDGLWNYCRIRQFHWHSWQGGVCPLPEGLVISVLKRNGEVVFDITNYLNDTFWYNSKGQNNVIAFKVTGEAEGWSYEV